MKRREELTKASVYLKRDELARLRTIYPEVGTSAIVRMLINKHLRELGDRALRAPAPETPTP